MQAVVALVGRPNVGKSTLFNVLTRTRDALVADFPGLTRDRKYGHASLDDCDFMVIDTGGLSGEAEELDQHMARQTRQAISESTLVLFLVDARDGMTSADENIADELRRLGKPVILVLNKTDGLDAAAAAAEFYALGLDAPVEIAAAHNRGLRGLQQRMLAHMQQTVDTVPEQGGDGIKVAFVGRPNVGKSTLINRFMGEERVVVYDMPGTTRDSVFVPFERDGKQYTLIDTAGVRRRRSVQQAVEKFSVIKSMQAVEQANVVVMMIDARQEVADQDLHLLGFILEAGRALVLVINKWDGLDEHQKQKIRDDIDKQLEFVRFAELFFISALHGSNVGLLFGAIDRAYESATRDLATPELTDLLQQAVEQHQPPLVRGRRIKLRYAHQGGMNPPRIVIHGNQTELTPPAYQRYLSNFFREKLNIVGTPVKIEFKGGGNPYAGKKNRLTRRQQSKRNRMIRYVKRRQQKRKQRR